MLAAAIASTLTLTGFPATPASADPLPTQGVITPPPGSGAFGEKIYQFPNGNLLITDPLFDDGALVDVGAFHVYDGETYELISTMKGAHAGDKVGNGLIRPQGDNGAIVVSSVSNGAITYVDGSLGRNGVVGPENSLVGSHPLDFETVRFTTFGSDDLVVWTLVWDGAQEDSGAITIITDPAQLTGAISAGTSLLGSTTGDLYSSLVTPLPTGGVVLSSWSWDYGSAISAGMSTLAKPNERPAGVISAANSLIGTNTYSGTGAAVVPLTNGNYVVVSQWWQNGSVLQAGATTWVNGLTGLAGEVSDDNSLVGTQFNDGGWLSVVALANGNYLSVRPAWTNGTLTQAGAITWVDGSRAAVGVVSPANSFVGKAAYQRISAATVLPNGDYVLGIPEWNTGGVAASGFVSFRDGTQPLSDFVPDATNSLVGTRPNDRVGSGGVTTLPNGDMVLGSPSWFGGRGAATYIASTSSPVGEISATNSLVGEQAGFAVGQTVTVLDSGNYALAMPSASIAAPGGGGITVGDGHGGSTGVVTAANSIASDVAGSHFPQGVIPRSGDSVILTNPLWNGGRGAVMLANLAPGASGIMSAANAIVGSTPGDEVGARVTQLTNGNYVIYSPFWSNPPATYAGAITCVNVANPAVGPISAANSVIGNRTDDGRVGNVIALSNGDYIVAQPRVSTATAFRAGAITFGRGDCSTVGPISASNSLIGSTTNDQLGSQVATVGGAGEIAPGYYAINNPRFDGNGVVDGGAVTLIGPGVPLGSVTPENSIVGNVAGAGPTLSIAPTLTADGKLLVAQPAEGTFSAVTVPDLVAPTIDPATVPDTIEVATRPGEGSATIEFVTPTATDDRGIRSMTCDPTSGIDFPVGTTTVTCTATDFAGNSTDVSFDVTVTATPPDDEAPTFTSTQDDIEVATAPGASTAVVTFPTPTATDNYLRPTVTCDPVSGTAFPIGTTTVTCIAVDSFDNTSELTFDVTVIATAAPDTTAPVFPIAPADVQATVPAGEASGVVSFPTPVASDDSGVAPTVVCDPASGSSFPVGVTTVSCVATDAAGNTAETSFAVTVAVVDQEPPVDVADYVSISPARLADTRRGASTVDGLQAGGGPRAQGSTLEVQVGGRGGVPANAAAAVLNVTAVDAGGNGFVTVFPCGADRPLASNLNYSLGATVPNAVIAKVGVDGKVCVYVSQPTDVIVDVNGYFPNGTTFVSTGPARVLDTRPDERTADGQQQGAGKNVGGNVTEIQIRGRGGVPADATSVALNVTVTDQEAGGFVTVYPCGTTRPLASSLNAVAGQTVANMVVSGIGSNGKVCVFTQATTHLVADINGYFGTDTDFHGFTPARLLDTRSGATTFDDEGAGAGMRPDGSTTVVTVAGRGGVPAGATTAVLNVTATEAAGAGFVTVYPCGIDRPLASNLNYSAGQTVPNAVVTKIGADGTVCLYTNQPTHLITDVTGYLD